MARKYYFKIRKVVLFIVNYKKTVAVVAVGMASLIGTALMQSGSASADTVVDSSHVQVVSGDTLSKIAQEHDTTVSQLAQDNNISNVDLIHVGDVIAVTPGSESSESTNQQATSTVEYQNTNINNTGNNVNTGTASQSVSNNYNNSSVTSENSTVHDQFINAGGTEAMWNAIVMPESGGNPNATNGQYSGLGQTNQSWGTGTVAQQTQGMINYANSRYGSISNAISFRASNGWW